MIPIVNIKTVGFEKVEATIDKLKGRLSNVEPALKKARLIMLRSIDLNFRGGGRPTWKPLAKTTLFSKIKKRYSRLPLTRTGDLRASITGRTSAVAGKATLTMGTAIKYAKFHQFGTSKIPKRIFLLFQDSDLLNIKKIIRDHTLGK